jgi:hypothetical protein
MKLHIVDNFGTIHLYTTLTELELIFFLIYRAKICSRILVEWWPLTNLPKTAHSFHSFSDVINKNEIM